MASGGGRDQLGRDDLSLKDGLSGRPKRVSSDVEFLGGRPSVVLVT